METHKEAFYFRGYTVHETTDTVAFQYTLSHGQETFDFIEKLTVPGLSTGRSSMPEPLLTGILDQLLLLLGISYWKLYCPKNIYTGPVSLTREQSDFWNTVYTKGLGEFFYKNQIDYRNLVEFPYSSSARPVPVDIKTNDRSLVQLGGGKDSIVTAELLKHAQKDFTLICVDAHGIHNTIAQKIGKPLIDIRRTIDPQLYELNKRPDTYNGHVPISAVYAFADLLMAALGGFRYIIASNEESANYGNVTYLGNEINHQWSKTFEFEKLFQSYVAKYITTDITYFSLLRPIKEIKIIELFSRHEQYHSLFTSCNTNFRRTVASSTPRWCGICPKCAFVFLLLSAFIPKQKLVSLFGGNLYENAGLAETFRELLGLTGIKPFECVGTPDECRWAFYLAFQRKEYEEDEIFTLLRKELRSVWDAIARTKEALFSVSVAHSIPVAFQPILKAL